MASLLRRVFAPPVLSDPDQTRVAGILNAVLVSGIAIVVIYDPILVWMLRLPASALGLNIAPLVVLCGLWVMTRRGMIRLTSNLFVLLAWFYLTALVLASGGLNSPLTSIFFVLALIAGILVGRRGATVIIALTTLTGVGTLFVQLANLLPEPIFPLHPILVWVIFQASLALCIALIYLSHAGLVRALDQARQEIAERARAERELVRRAEAEAIWNSVGKTIVATHDLDEILTAVIQTIGDRLRVETGSIWLRQPGTEELVIARTLQGDAAQFSLYRLRIGQGIAGWTVQTGQSARVSNPSNDPRFDKDVALKIGWIPRSILCVPLVLQDQVLGSIELLNKQNGEFTEDDTRLLESIAAPVAIAIQNARLDERVQKQFDELSALFRRVERAKQEWERTIDAIDEGIALVDNNCRIVRANRTLAKWQNQGLTELNGKYCYEVIHHSACPPAECPHAQLVAGGTGPQESDIQDPTSGTIYHLTSFPLQDKSGESIGTVNVLKDVTLEKRLQAQMIQSEKLAAMGRLAASLAHEINNPLQAIQGSLDLARSNAGNPDKQQRFLRMAQEEFNRLTNIVQHMLDFFRPSKGTQSLLDIRVVVDNALSLSTKRLQHAKVAIRVEWETEIPQINGVSNQLQQVFLNLILNAVEAMPEGGEIVIRGRAESEPASGIRISISDTGCGIVLDELPRIFEPFYTTKPNGTGLGLAVCHNIIANHGGQITAESTLGYGSTFTLWLPCDDSQRIP